MKKLNCSDVNKDVRRGSQVNLQLLKCLQKYHAMAGDGYDGKEAVLLHFKSCTLEINKINYSG